MTPRYRTDHAEEWRNELAEDMNYALKRSEYHDATKPNEADRRLHAIISLLCTRLAEAEEIKEV